MDETKKVKMLEKKEILIYNRHINRINVKRKGDLYGRKR